MGQVNRRGLNMIRLYRDRGHIIISIFGIKVKIKSRYKYTACKAYGLNKSPRKTKVIISLTSFPARINSVHHTINTLLTQSFKPDAVLLWLAQEEFPQKQKDLPQQLLDLQKYGLSIKWCHNIKSYKKLIFALKEFPKDIIVTADDDLYYAPDFLDILYKEYLADPNYIYAHRITRMAYKNGKVVEKDFKDYNLDSYKEASALDKLNGGAGALFPPKCFHPDVTKEDVFMNICPLNDDVWFGFMGVLGGYKTKLVKNHYFKLNVVDGTQGEYSICKTNEQGGQVSPFIVQTNNIVAAYPDLIDIFKQESKHHSKRGKHE